MVLNPGCPLQLPGDLFQKKTRLHPRPADLSGSKVGSEHPTQTLCLEGFTDNSNAELGLTITAMSHCDIRR